jgi:hypothetical protein
MTSPSITIRIDYGSESGSGAGQSVAVGGAVPTPFSAGGLSPQGAGQPGDMVPTPMDSVHGHVTGDRVPTPDFGNIGRVAQTPPVPSDPDEPSGKRGRR